MYKRQEGGRERERYINMTATWVIARRCAAWRLLSDRNRLVLTRRSKSNERPRTYTNAAAESVVQNIVILSALPRPVQASFDLCAGARSLLQRWIIPSNHCRATTKRPVSLGFCSICCSLLMPPSFSLFLSFSLRFADSLSSEKKNEKQVNILLEWKRHSIKLLLYKHVLHSKNVSIDET